MPLGPHPKVIEFECVQADPGFVGFKIAPDGSVVCRRVEAIAPVHPSALQ